MGEQLRLQMELNTVKLNSKLHMLIMATSGIYIVLHASCCLVQLMPVLGTAEF